MFESTITAPAEAQQSQSQYSGDFPMQSNPHNQNDPRYLSVSVVYQANGVMVTAGEGQIFDAAEECDRFTNARLKDTIKIGKKRNSSVEVIGSVAIPDDDSGFVWYGCIHPQFYSSSEFETYIEQKMTITRAHAMKRFPVL